MNKLPCLAAALLFAATTSACSADRWVEFDSISGAPPSVQVNQNRIEIPAGLAVGVVATPVEDGDPVDETLDMLPVQAGVLGVERALEDGEWVIFGISPGSTTVELLFGNEVVGEIPAVVTEQHESPD